MSIIGYGLVELGSGTRIAVVGSLPARITVADVGVCDFDQAGQVMPDSEKPTHKLVERVLDNEPPAEPYRIVGESEKFDGDVLHVTRDYELLPAERRLVSKATIVDRLQAAGKLDAARAALDAQDLYTRERWNSRSAIYADDVTAIALLQAIGADPAVILAPEE